MSPQNFRGNQLLVVLSLWADFGASLCEALRTATLLLLLCLYFAVNTALTGQLTLECLSFAVFNVDNVISQVLHNREHQRSEDRRVGNVARVQTCALPIWAISYLLFLAFGLTLAPAFAKRSERRRFCSCFACTSR